MHCGYCGVASCCVCIINKAVMSLSMQQTSSSDVIARTRFGHTAIIKRHILSQANETCCENKIGRGEEELLC
jgi:hypothetical protein